MACQSEVQTSLGLFDAARRELAELKAKTVFLDAPHSDNDLRIGSAMEESPMAQEASHDIFRGPPFQGPLLPKYLPSQIVVGAPMPIAEQEEVHYPCLLTSSSMARGRLFDMKQLKVKNTFIDGTESDDEDRPPMLKRKTMPCPPRSFELEAAEQTDEQQRFVQETSPAPADVTMTIIEPLKTRQPGFSKGSELHGSGTCKPCAWYWRPQGCANGVDCQHCHQCTAAELRARKKAKKLTKRDMASSAQNNSKRGRHHEEAQQQLPEQFLTAHPVSILVPVMLSN